MRCSSRLDISHRCAPTTRPTSAFPARAAVRRAAAAALLARGRYHPLIPAHQRADTSRRARLERAVGVLTDVLHCAYEPETWKEEMALLGAESDSVENVRAYAEHLDEVLAERLALFDELRKQLRMFTRTLT
jgi:hypothetical protein